MNVRRVLLVAVAVAMLAGCDKLGLKSPSADMPNYQGVDITGADYRYALPDQDGQPRTPDDFKGKVSVVFFGYTQCPDACPTTLAELAQVKKALGKDGERLQVVFISVDPERDTPEVLKAYTASFDPSFVALRGTPEQTAATAKTFKGFFAKSPGKTPGSYSVDHSTGSYVFDTQGRVRLFESYGKGAEALTADIKRLLSAG